MFKKKLPLEHLMLEDLWGLGKKKKKKKRSKAGIIGLGYW